MSFGCRIHIRDLVDTPSNDASGGNGQVQNKAFDAAETRFLYTAASADGGMLSDSESSTVQKCVENCVKALWMTRNRIDVHVAHGVEIMAPPGMEEMTVNCRHVPKHGWENKVAQNDH